MNCLNCSEEFNSTTHIPRLLPHCGHTLCSVCINSLINSNFIICTQCHELNMAFKQSDLPKNLAILRIQNESKKTFSDNTSETSKILEERCNKHNKKLQAFCLECFQYVCLQCVISHPKEHELKTMEEAVGHFKEETKKIIKFYREMKLNYKMQRVELEKADVLNTVNQHKAKIGKIFSEIKNYLEQKETQAINTLRTIYDAEVTRISFEEKELESLLNCYNKLVELSHTNSLKNCIENFSENRNLFNFNRQKIFYQGLLKRQKLTAATAGKGDLAHWDDSFNKFKDKIAKDIRNMLQIRAQLKQKPSNTYKNIQNNSSSQFINKSNTSKKESLTSKYYRGDPVKKQNNKQLHISLKQLDKFTQPPDHRRPFYHPTSCTLSNTTSRILQSRTPILLYGGYSEDQEAPGIELYAQNRPLPSPFNDSIGHVKFGIVNIANRVYIFGGKKDNKRMSEIYILEDMKLKEIGHMSRAKSGFGYCKKGNCCYVVGGNDGTILQEFEEYDFGNQEIKTLSRLTIPRDQLTAVLHKNEIFAIGGYNLDNELSLNTVERYNFESKKWIIGAPLVIQRRSHGCISIDSGLYVAGGYDGKNYLSTVQKYNEIQCRWQIVCQMMEQRCTFGISQNQKGDGFFVFGGFAHQPLSTCEQFSSQTRKCTPIQELKTKRFMLSAIQVIWEL